MIPYNWFEPSQWAEETVQQAAALGIAPDFRLMDENESRILRGEVLEEVLEACYEQADSKFLALSDLLTRISCRRPKGRFPTARTPMSCASRRSAL